MYINGDSPEIIGWKPTPRQSKALSSNAYELFYGGAAGGGKTDFLIVDFLAGVNAYKSSWRGILFRRKFVELGDIIRRTKELYLPLGAKYSETKKVFTFPNGAYLQLAYLDRDADVLNYQGLQYTWCGFDELGNYPTDYPWRYMISRVRSAEGAPCYIRGTGNPGGPGHAWIKTRFIDGFKPDTVYRNKSTDADTTHIFIPSLLDDNTVLMAHDPGYAQRMKNLPSHLYRALRYGDWDVFAGQVFDEWRRERHVCKPFSLDVSEWYKFYALDWGFARPFSLGKWAVNHRGRIIRYGEWYGCNPLEINCGIKMSSEKVAEKAWADAIKEGVTTIVADPSIWNKADGGASVADNFTAAGFRMVKANNDRINGWQRMHQYLMQNIDDDDRPMLIVFDHCVDFIRTIPTLLPDPNRPEDIDSSLEDHIADETRYALMSNFVRHPYHALEKQQGQWNFRRVGRSWDPLS